MLGLISGLTGGKHNGVSGLEAEIFPTFIENMERPSIIYVDNKTIEKILRQNIDLWLNKKTAFIIGQKSIEKIRYNFLVASNRNSIS